MKTTIEQLAADYHNRRDYAERLQQEADEAKAVAESKLAELVAAGKELGLVIGVAGAEPEWAISDHCIVVDSPDDTEWEGRKCVLSDVDYDDDDFPYSVTDCTGSSFWVRSIRRPSQE